MRQHKRSTFFQGELTPLFRRVVDVDLLLLSRQLQAKAVPSVAHLQAELLAFAAEINRPDPNSPTHASLDVFAAIEDQRLLYVSLRLRQWHKRVRAFAQQHAAEHVVTQAVFRLSELPFCQTMLDAIVRVQAATVAEGTAALRSLLQERGADLHLPKPVTSTAPVVLDDSAAALTSSSFPGTPVAVPVALSKFIDS